MKLEKIRQDRPFPWELVRALGAAKATPRSSPWSIQVASQSLGSQPCADVVGDLCKACPSFCPPASFFSLRSGSRQPKNTPQVLSIRAVAQNDGFYVNSLYKLLPFSPPLPKKQGSILPLWCKHLTLTSRDLCFDSGLNLCCLRCTSERATAWATGAECEGLRLVRHPQLVVPTRKNN